MKRRVGVKNASQSFALVQYFNNKYLRAKCNVNTHNTSFVAVASKYRILTNSTHLNVTKNEI